MSANDLLLWLSARGRGSWIQFRTAVDRLWESVVDSPDDGDDVELGDTASLPLHQDLRLNLERFGFAEFFGAPEERAWRVAPPVLAVTRREATYTGLILGARSDDLLHRIETAVDADMVRVGTGPHSPDSISIVASDLAVYSALARDARLYLQVNAPAAILATLRPIIYSTCCKPFELPLGSEWTVEQFRERQLRWASSTPREIEGTPFGLFRMRHRYRTEIVLRWSGRSYHSALQTGKFICLRRRRVRVLSYDRAALTLSMPAICRPPVLIERALLLCSGHLPHFEASSGARATLHYRGVPPDVARTVSALLRQELS